ncbi:hypothetical protein HX088_11320 [Empedobacter sp. 225-1]|uniref:hypothetical protein n=1 Tax=Empedobacter sp. 225-1 TaxID=2746725 RepID=UPI002578A3E3|nr:hypothetical protein [Empedobacter sp. 225-1]MDM1523856.1 hypothetical protein [Empedobacter sp. 225-1]
MKARTTLIEMHKTPVSLTSGAKPYFINGVNHAFSKEVERVINNSPTAFKCASKTKIYIAGKGVDNDIFVDRKNTLLSTLINRIGKDFAYFNGAFIHVAYKLNESGDVVVSGVKALDYTLCAVGKADDNGDSNYIFQLDDFENKQKGKSKNTDNWFYTFDQNTDVLKAQIINDYKLIHPRKKVDLIEAIKHYRGQILYINLTPEYTYSLPKVNPVFSDADTEFRISSYNNRMARGGFLGKTIFVRKGKDEDEAEEFNGVIKNMLGADGSDNVMVYDVDISEDIKDALNVMQIAPQFDDKLFDQTKNTCKQNIIDAFDIPELLISVGDNSLFGSSAEAFVNAEKRFSNQLSFERGIIEKTLSKILNHQFTITPMI